MNYRRPNLTQDQVVEASRWFEAGQGHQFGCGDFIDRLSRVPADAVVRTLLDSRLA